MKKRGVPPKIDRETLVKRLTELRQAGKTCKQIANELGCYTANYVSILICQFAICKRMSFDSRNRSPSRSLSGGTAAPVES